MNPEANPDLVRESAAKSEKDAFQVASYVDGIKTMFEMACIANATGFVPMRLGMSGPYATLENISQVFALQEDGAICPFPGVVDYVQGSAMAGGVFAIVRFLDKRIQKDLEYLKVGKGKYFTFFRPYHLWLLEAPISFARAYFDDAVTLVSKEEPVADVMAVAKRDLVPGERLDDFGGYAFYGCIDLKDNAIQATALPAGLAPGASVLRDKRRGEINRYTDVQMNESSLLVKLRRMQDAKSYRANVR